MEEIKFADIKDKLIEAIGDKNTERENICLVNGFTSLPLFEDLTENIVKDGPCVPMVMCVGEKTGRLYFYSLKLLLPEDNIGINGEL